MHMNTFYLNPRNEEKSINELRLDLPHFSHVSNAQLIATVILSIGFFLGFIVFAIFSYSMALNEYQFSHFGTDSSAIVTDCEMVAGRSGPHPLINYRYEVDEKTYFNTWLAQFDYEDCAKVPIGEPISIIYLRNDPGASIEGRMSERSRSGYVFALFLALGSSGHGLASILSTRRLFSYRPAIHQWRTQASKLVVLYGEIIALTSTGSRCQNDREITYRYRSPSGLQQTRKAAYRHRSSSNARLPVLKMQVIVLYFDEETIAIA